MLEHSALRRRRLRRLSKSVLHMLAIVWLCILLQVFHVVWTCYICIYIASQFGRLLLVSKLCFEHVWCRIKMIADRGSTWPSGNYVVPVRSLRLSNAEPWMGDWYSSRAAFVCLFFVYVYCISHVWLLLQGQRTVLYRGDWVPVCTSFGGSWDL